MLKKCKETLLSCGMKHFYPTIVNNTNDTRHDLADAYFSSISDLKNITTI